MARRQVAPALRHAVDDALGESATGVVLRPGSAGLGARSRGVPAVAPRLCRGGVGLEDGARQGAGIVPLPPRGVHAHGLEDAVGVQPHLDGPRGVGGIDRAQRALALLVALQLGVQLVAEPSDLLEVVCHGVPLLSGHGDRC